MTFLFFKTDEVTDFICFKGWLALTLTGTLLLLVLGIEVSSVFFEVCQAETRGFESALDHFLCRLIWLCETFFANFFIVSKESPFIFFLFCKRMDVQNLPKEPFYIFGTMRFTGDQKNFGIIFSIFSSCGYCRGENLTIWSPFAIFEP